MQASVALCTYNGEQFLRQQLDSILNQTVPVDEIIICDDGSTDSTVEILEQYAQQNPQIKTFCNPVNLGSVKNFEKAISLCKGDIIFLSDQDDVWVDIKVEKYIEHFNSNLNIDVLASNGYCIDEFSKIHEKYSCWDIPEFLREKNVNVNYFTIISSIFNLATGASMAVRKKIIHSILPFPTIDQLHHDEWIALLSTQNGSFAMLNEKYFYYRIHNNQQVGGVFYEKNQMVKGKLIELYRLDDEPISLQSYKSKLRKIIFSYYRNLNLSKCNHAYSFLFKDNLPLIAELFNKTKLNMKKNYPIQSYILNITDQLLPKGRILKRNDVV